MKKILAVLLAAFVVYGVYAQQLEIESVEVRPFDMGAARNPRIDLAGEPCALVRVEFTSPNAKIQGNVVGDVKYDVSEYLVYCCGGTKELRILHPSMRPTSIYFPDYGIAGLQPKVTYSVVLNFPRDMRSEQQRSSNVANDYIYPFKDETSGYFGFRNVIDEVVVSPRYEKAEPLTQDIYMVVENGRVGFIDPMGRTVVKCEYDFIYDCVDLFCLKKDGLWGIVGKEGEEILPMVYKMIQPVDGGGAIVIDTNDRWGWYDRRKREFVAPCDYDTIVVPTLLYANMMEEYKNPRPSERLVGAKKNGKWGFVERGGRVAIPFIYDDNQYTAPFSSAYNFNDGKAIVYKNGKYGMIDEAGNVVLPFDYTSISPHLGLREEGIYKAYTGRGKGVLLDRNCKVISPVFDAFGRGSEGITSYCDGTNDKWGLFNVVTGKVITPQIYDDTFWCNEGFCRVKIEGKGWNLVDKSGRELFSGYVPLVKDMSNGLALVKDSNDKYGYVNRSGSWVVEPQYDFGCDFGPDKLARVKKNDQWGCINSLGKVVIPFGEYDEISDGYSSADGKLNFRSFRKNGKYGYYGNGEWIVPCKYADNEELNSRLYRYAREHGITMKD